MRGIGDIIKELQLAIRAAKESSKVLSRYYKKNVKIERKSDKTPVTEVDRKSEKVIVSVIKKTFPEHNFLCEEFSYKKTDSDCTWVIDPLDGTRNFIRGAPFFGNCIALEKNGKIIAGVINMPAMNLLAYGAKGKGAFVNGKRIKVSDIHDVEKAFLVFGNFEEKFSGLIKKCEYNRGYGDTLGYILLAQGSVDIMLDTPKPWDIAAPKIIVEEAGGMITDFAGNDTIHMSGSGNSLSTNGLLHKKALDILKRG